MLKLICDHCQSEHTISTLQVNTKEYAIEIACPNCSQKSFYPLPAKNELDVGGGAPNVHTEATRQFHAANTVLLGDGQLGGHYLDFESKWTPAEFKELQQRIVDMRLHETVSDLVVLFEASTSDWTLKKTHESLSSLAWDTDSISELGALYRIAKDLRPDDGWADKGIKMVMTQAIGKMQMQAPRRSAEKKKMSTKSRVLLFGSIVMGILALAMLQATSTTDNLKKKNSDLRLESR